METYGLSEESFAELEKLIEEEVREREENFANNKRITENFIRPALEKGEKEQVYLAVLRHFPEHLFPRFMIYNRFIAENSHEEIAEMFNSFSSNGMKVEFYLDDEQTKELETLLEKATTLYEESGNRFLQMKKLFEPLLEKNMTKEMEELLDILPDCAGRFYLYLNLNPEKEKADL